jgi:3-oxoacyl-(acyl-carrier-protein) synthase III
LADLLDQVPQLDDRAGVELALVLLHGGENVGCGFVDRGAELFDQVAQEAVDHLLLLLARLGGHFRVHAGQGVAAGAVGFVADRDRAPEVITFQLLPLALGRAFDLNAACSGGTTALLTATSLMRAGVFRNALVVTSDLTTRYVRNDDPKTRLVFGDGAAAMLLSEAREDDPGAWTLVASTMGADGAGADLFWVPHGGTATPPVNGHRFEEVRTVEMDGRAVFRFGVERGVAVIDELCRCAGLAPGDVAWVIPHQANLRIISALRERCAIPPERFVVNIDRYGNTASSSIPLALSELLAAGHVRPGDTLLLVAFGAGLTWCGLALRAGG